MAISGDLKALNLTELFQTISQSGQQGTLTITDGARTKHFIFTARGITLETSEDQLTASLGDILLAQGKLTPEKLVQAEATAATRGEDLEAALLDLELVDRKSIDRALRTQVEEEMYEVFSWDEARFEFDKAKTDTGDTPQAAPKTRMLFNVSGLLMEAARRLDEWKLIHEVIPGLAAIVAPDRTLKAGDYEGMQKTVVDLLDGQRTVAQITAEGHVPRFDTCKFLKELVGAGKARLLEAKELAATGAARLEAGELDEGVALLRLALRQHPALHSFRLQLAEALESLERPGEASAEYRRLARVKLMQNDPKQAVAILQVACELAPEDLEAQAERFEAVVTNAEKLDLRSDALVKQQLPYVRSLIGGGRGLDAVRALDRLIAKAPDQPECWRLKVNLALEANDTAAAVDAYHHMLPMLEASGDRRALREALENILKLAPEDAAAQAQLEALQAGRASTVSSQPAPAPPKRGFPLKALVAVLLVLAGAGVLGWREFQARGAVAAARAKAEELKSAGKGAEAAQALRAAAAAWPWTLAVQGLAAEATLLELEGSK